MDHFYFPKSVYVDAHYDFMKKTGNSADKVQAYSLNNLEFFVEVVFSYLDGTPYPEMKGSK